MRTSLKATIIAIVLIVCGIAAVWQFAPGWAPLSQENVKVIGIVNPVGHFDESIAGFRKGLAEHGYIEGKNLRIIYRGPEVGFKDPQGEIARMLAEKVDLLYVLATPVTRAAKAATSETGTPVVFDMVSYPFASGIVTSLSQPGSNVTGVRMAGSTPVMLKWLKTIVPSAKRVFLPHNPEDVVSVIQLQEAKKVAGELGLELVIVHATTHGEVTEALANTPKNIDAICMMAVSVMLEGIDDFARESKARNIPFCMPMPEALSKGLLFAVGPRMTISGKRAGWIAARILKGAKPSEMPVDEAELYVSVNSKVAKQLNITFSEYVLTHADVVSR